MKHRFIQHAFTAAVCSFLFGITFLLATAPVRAQDESAQIEQAFKRLSSDEEAKLRQIVNTPLKKDTTSLNLENQINEKVRAATRLADNEAVTATYKEAVEAFPSNATFLNDYGWRLFRSGQTVEANTMMQRAADATTNDHHRAFILSNIAQQAYEQNQDTKALETIQKAEIILKSADRRFEWQQRTIGRTLSNLYGIKSQLASRRGRLNEAVSAAFESEIEGRRTMKLLSTERNDLWRWYAQETLITSLSRKFNALNTAGRYAEADNAMRDYLRIFNELEIPKNHQSLALGAVANLRFELGEFAIAQQLYQRSYDIGRSIGTAETTTGMLAAQRMIALSLIGQKQYTRALAIFENFDKLAGESSQLKARVLYPFHRGVTYLLNGKNVEATKLFDTDYNRSIKQYGVNGNGEIHFFTAQSAGLYGVALWRLGSKEAKEKAYSLLQIAIKGIMSPDNADLRNGGIRQIYREMIFSTYIEAASQTSPADALAALGIADWLRGGLVQEALGDAAVRAAASNSALSDLVRQDQDARNEIKGLRSYLSGEAGGTASPLPQVAAQMRERIAVLEKTRADVQVKIKASFPDYEKLVRPSPPSTADIQARLKAEEALVVLQPTDDAVFVWVVNKQGTGAFHRAALTSSDLAKLVKRLRTTLDVAGIQPNHRPAFDAAASQELYAKLLSPVQQGLAGKTHLIVAAGGVLGQIPFGVLQTSGADSWLIKQAAVSHVPSVAAWLSMRSLPHKVAEQPMLAWGDPLFNIAQASNTNTASAKGDVRKVVLTRANTSVDLEKEDPRSALKYANITPLPETRDELTAIAKTLGANADKDLILGSAATRDSVLAQNKNGELAKRRVVAFATHGLMAGDLPNLTQPALAMAGTKDDVQNVLAPLLTLEDVLTLKLNADWVVLSACNTAAADGKAEEALSGLARGFFYAGSRSMLVTHWAVDSDSAVQLTTETFKNYQSKPQEAKAESLRQAMLMVMNNPKTEHPTYWAPYALVGDGAR